MEINSPFGFGKWSNSGFEPVTLEEKARVLPLRYFRSVWKQRLVLMYTGEEFEGIRTPFLVSMLAQW